MKKTAAFVVVVAVFGLGYLAWNKPSQADAPAVKSAQTAPAPEVSVVTMQAREVRLTSELPGRTSVYQVAEIRPQVGGIIQKRAFKEGTEVKTGDLLYQIDPATYEANVAQAKASVAKALSRSRPKSSLNTSKPSKVTSMQVAPRSKVSGASQSTGSRAITTHPRSGCESKPTPWYGSARNEQWSSTTRPAASSATRSSTPSRFSSTPSL